MIIYLPQDVNEIIYDFLIFSKYHNKIFCISKKCTENIFSSQTMKKYNTFNERINMAKEDKNENIIHIRKNKKIFKLWNQYHLNSWYIESKKRPIWKIGDYVDAYDYVKGWCPAKIINTHIERNPTIKDSDLTFEYIRKYEVKFLGWKDEFIEKLEINKITNLGKYTVNPLNLYESISRDCSNNNYWTLCKKETETVWNMHRIIQRIIEYDCIKLLTYIGTIYVVKKNNIENIVRHITDASTFFSLDNEYCFFKRRKFEF
mgnify:FL=1